MASTGRHGADGPAPAGPLLDRADETALLAAVARDTLRGSGALVLVEGPAGIGKSRLLDEAADRFRAAAGRSVVRVLRGTGDELHRHRALGLVRGLRDDDGGAAPPVAAGPPDTAEPDPAAAPDGGAAAVQGALASLSSVVGPGGADAALLLLDDLHWADAGSLRVLEELAAALPGLPIAVVAATRAHEPGAFHVALDRLRARAGDGWLHPAPLGSAAVARLAAGSRPAGAAPSADEVADLVARSGGNPFLVRELLRAGGGAGGPDAVPDTVRHAVRLHLGRLPPAATALARAVAVLGQGTPLRTAAALADLDPRDAEAAADALARVDVLRRGDPLAFEHALIADAVGAELEPFGRARMHRRAAELLHEHGAGDDVVAAHLLQVRADGDPWVAETLLRAGRATNAAGDPVAAGRLLERARREPPPPALVGEVVGALAEADALAGRPGATERLREALGLIDDPRRRAELQYVLSRAFHLGQRFDDAARSSKDALDVLSDDDPLYDRVLSGWMTDALFVPGLHPDDDPRAAAVRTGIRGGAGAAGPLVAHATNLAALDGAPAPVVLDLARRAVSRDPNVDATAHGFPFTHVSTGLIHADLLDEQIGIATEAVAAARRRSNVLAEMTALGGRAYARHLRGDVDAALEDAARAFEISRASDTPYSAWWLVVLVEAHLSAGDPAAARAALALQETVTIPAFAALRVRELEAAVALVGGDPEAALVLAGEVEEARASLGTIRLSLGTWEGRWTLARALRELGRDGDARETARRERERTADATVGRHRADALTLDGVVRGAAGVPALEEAVALLRASPARILLLRALFGLGLARRAAGEPAGARDALLEALELTAVLGVPRRGDEVRAALRTVGARPRQAVRTGRDALTAAELDVARLAAAGLGNPDIAARRHISRKTVETHLGRVYRKLGITSRAALTGALEDDDGPA